tara:strand:- start:2954 stop:3280 length:327 start_codon:yes stop_codon:yes gene_type:complete
MSINFVTADHCVSTNYRGTLINTSYDTLIQSFGLPTYTCEVDEADKVQVEWLIKFDDGTAARIYDWKQVGTSPRMITEWNVGGCRKRGKMALLHVRTVLLQNDNRRSA